MRLPTPKRIAQYLRNLRLVDSRKLYQLWEAEHLRRLLEHYDVDCVFDVGANHGQYARMLRSRAGYRGWIVSFEPHPGAVAHLRHAAARDKRWLVEEVAVSECDGRQTFNLMGDSQFSSLSQPSPDQDPQFAAGNAVQQAVEVQVECLATAYRRLRERLGFERPFLKMDTQGYDARIVAAGRGVVRNFVGLQSELSVRRLYVDSQDYRDALALYESVGFTLSAFVPNNAGHFPRLIETDCIMVRSDLIPDGP